LYRFSQNTGFGLISAVLVSQNVSAFFLLMLLLPVLAGGHHGATVRMKLIVDLGMSVHVVIPLSNATILKFHRAVHSETASVSLDCVSFVYASPLTVL
jgi:hypothetical protein